MYLTKPETNWGDYFNGEGFTPHKQEFLCIAARIGEETFCRWIMPAGEISPAMTRRTLIVKLEGKLVNKERISMFPTSNFKLSTATAYLDLGT